MPKVYEIVPFWPAEVFIQRHLSAFARMRFQPQIFTHKTDYSLRSSSLQSTDQKAKEIPRFDDLNVFKKALAAKSLWNDFDLLRDKRCWRDKVLINFFKGEKPDLIHFHWANLAVKLAWIPLELNIPYTFSMRGHDIKQLTLNSKKYVDDLAKAIQLSSGIHSVSDNLWHEAAFVCGIDETSVFHRTIYTTVPTSPINQFDDAKTGPFVFITTGRFHWMKNFVGLLIAFKKLLDEGLNTKLIIVGDGDQKECLSYWTKHLDIMEFVTFTGTLPYLDIKTLFEQSDGYIQPSLSEGFSNSLAEAMALGVPVFATSVGGTPEIIKDDVNGYLLDVEHPENWWKKLILVRDRQKMQAIRLQAWNDACEKFSAQIHAEKFKEFYYQSMGIKEE